MQQFQVHVINQVPRAMTNSRFKDVEILRF